MAGVPMKVAQTRAGHATAAIAMAVYRHILRDADKQAWEAVAEGVGKVTGLRTMACPSTTQSSQ